MVRRHRCGRNTRPFCRITFALLAKFMGKLGVTFIISRGWQTKKCISKTPCMKCYLFPCILKEQPSVGDPRGFHRILQRTDVSVSCEQNAQVWRAATGAAAAAKTQDLHSAWRSRSHLPFLKRSLASIWCVKMRKNKAPYDDRNWARPRGTGEEKQALGCRYFDSVVKRSGPPRDPAHS